MEKKRKFAGRRRRYITDKSIQYKYVGLILLCMAVLLLVAMGIIYYVGWSQLVAKMADVYPQARLVSILKMVYWRLFLGFLLLVPFAVASAILLSHRVAGPLVRIKRSLERIAEGDFDFVLNLRKTDELQYIAEVINKIVRNLGGRVR